MAGWMFTVRYRRGVAVLDVQLYSVCCRATELEAIG